MKIICVLIAALMCLSSTVVLADASQATGTAADTELDATWKLVQEAYIYSFPLVLMSATEAKMTNVEEPDALQGPVNTINHAMQLANADSRNVVTPNVDTIYSQIWLDLSDDAVVFHKPAVDRFCSVQVLDAYTNAVAMLGTGGDTDAECTYIFTGPDFTGDIPDGMVEVELPTNLGWVLVRTLCSGQADMDNVRAIQQQMWAMTLESYNTGAAQPVGEYDPEEDYEPLKYVLSLTPSEYFSRANELMVDNPPAEADAPLMERICEIGVGPGLEFDAAVLGGDAAQQWTDMLGTLRQKLVTESSRFVVSNGVWQCYGEPVAEFGTEYAYRALIALGGLGANPVNIAIYPKATTDNSGERLTGARCYVLHFEADELPPVATQGFWSLTAYNSADDMLIDNPIDRYCINDRSEVEYNADGSLDIYIQCSAPDADKQSNWLPVCEGEFHLYLRMYLPDSDVLGGEWVAPQIVAVDN